MRSKGPTAGELPVDRKHLVPHQLLADDGQQLRARLVHRFMLSARCEGAGAVIDLAAFDANEYPVRPEQRRTIRALSDEIGVQR